MPTIDELRSHSGQVYQHGQEIVPDEDGEVWIVDEKSLTLLLRDLENLSIYNFTDYHELSQEELAAYPEKEQEYNNYVKYQEYAFKAQEGAEAA